MHLQSDGFSPSFECAGGPVVKSNTLVSGVPASAKAGVVRVKD